MRMDTMLIITMQSARGVHDAMVIRIFKVLILCDQHTRCSRWIRNSSREYTVAASFGVASIHIPKPDELRT